MSAPQPTLYPRPSAIERVWGFVARVLWTAVPFLTLGIFAWIPALRAARRRGTTMAWWWFTALVASAVIEIVLLIVVPANGKDGSGAAAGGFVVTYIITASVYSWRCGADAPPMRLVRAPRYPMPPTAWMPAPYGQTPPPVLPATPAPGPAPSAAPEMAAEVQAELRELRGLLGGGDAP